MERLITTDGVELCVETFGEPTDPTILLIQGQCAAMDWWYDDLCERLAAGRRHVLRYDQRDTGRSTCSPPSEPDYTFADLAADVIGILDALDVDRAHLVGLSAGGALAQVIALAHPERVATLTLVDTTAVSRAPGGEDLPPPEAALLEHFAAAASRPPVESSDLDAVIDRVVEDQRAYMRLGFDEERVRGIARRVAARSVDLAASLTNHGLVDEGDLPRAGVETITAPTLVVHGTADPLFPLAHGRALAASLPGATLLPLEGVGHEVPPPQTYDVVVPALLRHTSANRINPARRPGTRGDRASHGGLSGS